jgi:cobyrinic acid a,c-diamide synthase
MKSHFLIGVTPSGSGKTTLALELLRALRNRGIQVQPFKCKPDYIDTHYYYEAAGKASVNLDLFMMPEKHVSALYGSYAAKADVSVTEGVMELCLGYRTLYYNRYETNDCSYIS